MITINQLYNPNFAGRIAQTSELWTLRVFSNVWNFGSVSIDGYNNNQQYTLTGWYIARNGYNYYQTTIPTQYVKLDGNTVITDRLANPSGNGQELVNKIISNNKRILENNLICARFSDKLDADQCALLFDLQSRLEMRNNALLNSTLISTARETYPGGYINLQNYLTDFMANGKIGVAISGTAVIVVSAIVIASMAAAAYFAYLAYYNESMDDVEYSDELTAILSSKLTADEFAQLKSETAGIVTKARLKSSLGTFSTLFNVAAWGFLGYAIYKFVSPKIKSKTQKNKKNG